MILTYKYRIKDKSARKALVRHAYAVNQVWNWCVGQQRDNDSRYRAGAPKRRWATHFDFNVLCKGVGVELGIHQQTVQAICKQFVGSRDKNRRCPGFRASFGSKRSLGWVPFQKQSRQIQGNSVSYLGKSYRLFGVKRRALPDTANGGVFIEDASGRWYVCFYVDAPKLQGGTDAVGIDLGLKSLATMSDGRKIEAPRHYRTQESKLAAQDSFGNKRRVRAIHAKIKNTRKDFLHKLSTSLVRSHSLIAVGDVSPSRLGQTLVAKSVYDAGWSTLRSQLRYKCQQAGVAYLDVDERFTTQTCSECGALPASRPKGIAGLGIRRWDCSECGASHDRDVNAARNILAVALSAQRLVGESREVVAHA